MNEVFFDGLLRSPVEVKDVRSIDCNAQKLKSMSAMRGAVTLDIGNGIMATGKAII